MLRVLFLIEDVSFKTDSRVQRQTSAPAWMRPFARLTSVMPVTDRTGHKAIQTLVPIQSR